MPRNTTEKLVSDFKLIAQDLEEFLKSNTPSSESWQSNPPAGRLEQVFETAREKAQYMEQKIRSGAMATDKAIRSHPYQTLGIALGVGMVLGWLIKRR